MTRARVGLAAAGLSDYPYGVAALDGDVHVAKHRHGRGAARASSVARGDVPDLQGGRLAFVLGRGLVALPGGRRRTDGGHQPPRVFVGRAVDDLVRRALLLDVPGIEDDDVVRDLGDHGEVVGSRRPPPRPPAG